MGGGEHGHGGEGGDFRAKVWSMSGGPYCRPKHWRRNTAIAMFGVFLVCIPIAMKSAELEQRPHMPDSLLWRASLLVATDLEQIIVEGCPTESSSRMMKPLLSPASPLSTDKIGFSL